MILIFEIIGGFVFFMLLGILSLIIVPSFFGCLGFILFWIVLISLIIFFSVNIVSVIAIALVVYILLAIVRYLRYQKLCDYDTYLAVNSQAYQNGKPICKFCNCEHIINKGLFGRSSKSRYYVCMNCRNWLYKVKVL